MFFYTDFNKTLAGNEAHDIVTNSIGRVPSRSVSEYMMVPNFSYHQDEPDEISLFLSEKGTHNPTAAMVYNNTGAPKTLEGLFTSFKTQHIDLKYDIYWCCCQALELNETQPLNALGHVHVGNTLTAINLTEMPDGFYDYDYDLGIYKLIFAKNPAPHI